MLTKNKADLYQSYFYSILFMKLIFLLEYSIRFITDRQVDRSFSFVLCYNTIIVNKREGSSHGRNR